MGGRRITSAAELRGVDDGLADPSCGASTVMNKPVW